MTWLETGPEAKFNKQGDKMINWNLLLINMAKAVLISIDDLETSNSPTHDTLQAPQRNAPQSRPTATSNGIPVCSLHGKAMRPSKYKEGQYYCGARLDDGTYCREKANG